MKILHLGDLHLGKNVNGFSMIEDQEYILKQIIEISKNNKIDTVLIAGDVYDKSLPSSEAVILFDRFLTDLSDTVSDILIISGNHDSPERLSFASELMEKSHVYISKRLSESIKKVELNDEYGKINFYMLPFVKIIEVKHLYPDAEIQDINDAIKTIISKISLNKNERNILIAHQFVTGAQTAGSEIMPVGGLDNIDAEIFSAFDYTALGHIHRPQKITDKIRYSGSILKYSSSEVKSRKSVPIIDIKEKGEIDITLLPLRPIHDMIEIKGLYNELMSPEYYNKLNTNDYIYAVLTDDIPEPDAMAKLRSVYKNIMGISFENLSKTIDTESITNEPISIEPLTIVEQFFNEMYGKPINEKQHDIIVQTITEIMEEEQ